MYRVAPRARADLVEIWDYTSARWSIDRADAYVEDVTSAMELAGREPELGSRIDAIRPGYRKRSAGSHVIVYRQERGLVTIIRVLHKSMDLRRHL